MVLLGFEGFLVLKSTNKIVERFGTEGVEFGRESGLDSSPQNGFCRFCFSRPSQKTNKPIYTEICMLVWRASKSLPEPNNPLSLNVP